MKSKLLIAKKQFCDLGVMHSHEIKAKDAYPCVKYHILESIVKKDLSVSYIIADLNHIKSNLLSEKNIFYNYLMRLLIERLVSCKDNNSRLNIICDNHTTKVSSANSFEEYIKLYLLYERNNDIDLNVVYMDSDDRNAYPVQAADYVANALYGKYEYNDSTYYNVFKSVVNCSVQFPYKCFGR